MGRILFAFIPALTIINSSWAGSESTIKPVGHLKEQDL